MAKIVKNYPAAPNGFKAEFLEFQNKQGWLDLRKRFTSGTESSVLLNQNDFTSEYALFMDKTNQINNDINDTTRMLWGRRLENEIRDGIAQDIGYKPSDILVCNTKYFYSGCDAKLGATPDAIFKQPTDKVIDAFGKIVIGAGIFEIKNVDGLIFKQKWTNNEPPLMYLIQIQHYMAVFGYQWAILGALVGGNSTHVYYYERHEPTITAIKKASIKFWDNVNNNITPIIDNSEVTAEIIANKYAVVKETEADLTSDNELPEVCEKYLKLKSEVSELNKEVRGLKSKIMDKLGENSAAIVNGFYLKAPETKRNGYTVQPRTQRTLTVKEA